MARKDRAIGAATVLPSTGGRGPDPRKVQVHRESTKSPAFLSIYANDVDIQATPWDLRLVLGEITDRPSLANPTISIKELCEVRISPQLAKQLAIVLMGQLRAYEEQFGEIPGPKD